MLISGVDKQAEEWAAAALKPVKVPLKLEIDANTQALQCLRLSFGYLEGVNQLKPSSINRRSKPLERADICVDLREEVGMVLTLPSCSRQRLAPQPERCKCCGVGFGSHSGTHGLAEASFPQPVIAHVSERILRRGSSPLSALPAGRNRRCRTSSMPRRHNSTAGYSCGVFGRPPGRGPGSFRCWPPTCCCHRSAAACPRRLQVSNCVEGVLGGGRVPPGFKRIRPVLLSTVNP